MRRKQDGQGTDVIVPAGAKGTLHVVREAPGSSFEGPWCTHVSTFVNDLDRKYLEDNDIRGFPDGRFNWAWNQAGQGHVRVGRDRALDLPPKYGEDELFRTLQRWSGIELPDGARVRHARLSLWAETRIETPSTFYIYAVRRNWEPGTGGVRQDNVSVPAEGEVWWRDARHGQEEWGLPGAGFSAREHPEADTDASALAVARCASGERVITLEGERLTRYVDRRLAEGEPLLFLLKLGDLEEDQPGSVVDVLSGEYGDDANPGFRPRLRLEWETPAAWCRTEEVFLEHARGETFAFPNGAEKSRVWVSFTPEEGFESPTVFRRGESPGEEPTTVDPGWRRVCGPFHTGPGETEIRLLAVRNPIALGKAFSTEFHDTWVVTAPPEEQKLEWRFTSPSGIAHRIHAAYEGDFSWTVEFVPDEIGRWTVQWRHQFWGPPRTGPEGTFDVIALDLEEVCRRLRDLAARTDEASGTADFDLASNLHALHRLERAGVALLTPETHRAGPGDRLRAALDRARESLWGREMPKRAPMKSHPLRYEAGGRRLLEPIPKNRNFRGGDRGGASMRRAVVEALTRWGRRISKALGWRAPRQGGTEGSGDANARGGEVR